MFVNRQIAEFVENEHLWREILFEFAFEFTGSLCRSQCIDRIDRCCEEYRFTCKARRIAKSSGKMRLANSHRPEQDYIRVVVQKLEAKEILHRHAIDLFRPTP